MPLGREQKTAYVLGPVPLTWETQTGCRAPGKGAENGLHPWACTTQHRRPRRSAGLLGREQKMAYVLGPVPLTRETQMECRAPGFSLAAPIIAATYGLNQQMKIFLSLQLFL